MPHSWHVKMAFVLRHLHKLAAVRMSMQAIAVASTLGIVATSRATISATTPLQKPVITPSDPMDVEITSANVAETGKLIAKGNLVIPRIWLQSEWHVFFDACLAIDPEIAREITIWLPWASAGSWCGLTTSLERKELEIMEMYKIYRSPF